LTDGSILYTDTGSEIKSFNVKDGLGLASWIMLGRSVAIITGRNSPLVERRAKELKIPYIYQGIKEKRSKLEEIMREMGIWWEHTAVIGDDLNDYSMMRDAGYSFAPSNADRAIRELADFVLRSKGGEGAVREMIDHLIDSENLREEMRRLWSAR
jgi:3-deoxy-D-manno-octulosonate 8-phosphate phosphatase (KDO 8-P phosphatase)